MIAFHAAGIRAGFDPSTGLLDGFTVTDGGRQIAPLHRAPWVDTDEALPPDAAPHMRRLGGDFFCAPFAGREDGSALHGWPANSPWTVVTESGGTLRAVLNRPVSGATLVKELALIDGHPLVYQRHVFIGGQGHVPVANHANLSLAHGGLIRTSPKVRWETPASPQESDPARGRSALLYPAQSEDPRRFPGLEGPVDLTRYPWNPRHEDFVMGIERPGNPLGWTAVTRPQEGDLYLSLRAPRQLPLTMLWHSNGGRDYAPWSGRHVGCLGIEEGAAATMLARTPERDLSGPGTLALAPEGTAEVRHVIGALDWPTREPVASVRLTGDRLDIEGEAGARRSLPFRAGFLD